MKTENELGQKEKQANAEIAKIKQYIENCGGLNEAARVFFQS